MSEGPDVSEVVPGVHRFALPLGIHGVPSVSSYLLAGDGAGDTLVDCGIAADAPGGGDPRADGTGALGAALAACGSAFDRIARLVVTHAHIDHFGLAGEVVRRSGGELWMHRDTELDLAKYAEPEEAIDQRTLMLADHGLLGPELTDTAEGLRDWLPVMPSIGRPSTLLDGGEQLVAGDRTWEVVHTPGHSPGHVCLWNAADRLLCSGDHLLALVSPPVTFERGSGRTRWAPTWPRSSVSRASTPRWCSPGTAPPSRRARAGPRRSRGTSAGSSSGSASWWRAATARSPS